MPKPIDPADRIAVLVDEYRKSENLGVLFDGLRALARETLADVTDPSLSLVADLADGINWQDAHDAGLAPRGSAEHAVTHLNDAELRELQRLLKAELAHATD